MTLKLNAKNPRIVTDELGNELFYFRGLHLEDLREILAKVNQSGTTFCSDWDCFGCTPAYSKSKEAI